VNEKLDQRLVELLMRLTERSDYSEIHGHASGDRRMKEYEAQVTGNRDTGRWRIESTDGLTEFTPENSQITYSNMAPATVYALTHQVPTEVGLLFPLRLPVWGRRRDTWEPIMVEDNGAGEHIVYLRGMFDRSMSASVVLDTKYSVARRLITPHEGHALRDYKPAS
jgi:hypothetical protein